jgi:cathepsin A (carboxypeptidase C)
MKLLASTVLLGVASAGVTNQQRIISNPFKAEQPLKEAITPIKNSWSKALNHLAESMKDMSSEAKLIWDEVATQFPESFDKASFFSSPKPHKKKPDSTWDYIVKGADIQSVWVENAKGEKEREIDGKLDSYNLRAKKVDPAALGVDKVKQYSGYLDDEEDDKHLFYCKRYLDVLRCPRLMYHC